MAIQIGAKPDSGFDDPLGMLQDCHRRIERFLHILCVVVDRAAGRALTIEEMEAVQSALQYFRSGGQRHTADEEESLFPRLRNEINAEKIEGIEELEHDHQIAGALHDRVDRLYSSWVASGSLSKGDKSQLNSVTKELKHLYKEHILIEETVLFPRAAQLLDGETLAAIGQEFRARRAYAGS